MPATRYLVTGASGFVGSRLVALLNAPCETLAFGASDWRPQVDRARFDEAVVIHLAARAHRGGSPAQYHADNVEKTRVLADAAARGGARRFVFLSSIKVNGEATTGRPFTAHDDPAPEDAYGRSKRDAEAALAEVAARHSMEAVIVRCPLVYGAPAKGHLATLLRIADSPWPLPFASIDNRRSFIALDDLCRVLVSCGDARAAAGKTYLVAHREPVSTARLVASVRRALGRPPRLFPVPAAMLEAAAALCGLRATMMRLTRSLEVDPSLAERELGWRAQTGIDRAIDGMARAYRASR